MIQNIPIPLPLKKVLKYGKAKICGQVTVKSAKWMRKEAEKFEHILLENGELLIHSDLERRISYPQISMVIECAINELSEKNKNSINNMIIIKNPYQYAPLCALALFDTKKETYVRVTVKGKTSDCDVCYELPKAKKHRVPILGLYPNYENTILIELFRENHKKIKQKTVRLKTDSLRGKSAKIKITKESVGTTEYLYGLTLVYGGGDDGICPYAFDRNGDLRFCFAMAPKTYGFFPISKGRFLFLNKKIVRLTATNPASIQLSVVDQMGRFHKTYCVEKGVHHDFAETKSGNFVAASNSMEEPENTLEDTVIEIDGNTGNILKEIKMSDYIDKKFMDASDWAHLNTVEWNEMEKTVMVCLRNLHTVMKINYDKKEVVWVLANPEFYKNSSLCDKVLTPKGENMRWFFQAHASYFIHEDLDKNPDTKHLIIYDNHTQKRRPVAWYDQADKSYVYIYTINEKEKTVELWKSFPIIHSNIRSNAVFEAKAQRVMAMSGKIKEGTRFYGQIEEIDYNTGKTLNCYTINHGYYRAYPFAFASEEMSKAMDINLECRLGKLQEVKKCPPPDVEHAEKIPEMKLEEQYANEEERSRTLQRMAKKGEVILDAEQDIARIRMYLEDNILYTVLFDHQLEGIYLVGNKHTYVRDFTVTVQERPEYFARNSTTDAIPLENLEEDNYKIYFKHTIGLYDSGHKIELIKK